MRLLRRFIARMWYDLIDRDIERLLTGNEPHNSDLIPLRSFVSTLADMGKAPPSPQFVDDHASLTAMMIRAARDKGLHDEARRPAANLWLGLRRKTAALLYGLIMVSGLTGVAWAANTAIPGNWNYEIDRALEGWGIGAGGATERIEELVVLNEEGKASVALEHVVDVSPEAMGEAAAALTEASETVASLERGSQISAEVRERLTDLLRYLEENRGQIDGRTVAEYAHEITDSVKGKPESEPEEGGRQAESEDHSNPKEASEKS